jgi:hypothetical protein
MVIDFIFCMVVSFLANINKGLEVVRAEYFQPLRSKGSICSMSSKGWSEVLNRSAGLRV